MIGTAFHIVAGTVALAAGTGALIHRKGGQDHARWGNWFFGSMLAMASSGGLLAATNGDPVTAIIGVFTCYLLATSWTAAQTAYASDPRIGGGLAAAGLACAIGEYACAWIAANSASGRIGIYDPTVPIVFGSLALLAVALDLNMLLRRTVALRQRIARHLWRMCTAFFIAAGSLFLGQQDDVFFFMAGSPVLFIPPFAVLGTMAYWIFRMRFGRGLNRAGSGGQQSRLSTAAAKAPPPSAV
jgi:hypothetical protein